MAFLARLLRFLFWVVLLTWGVSLLRRFLSQFGSTQPRSPRDFDVPNDTVTQRLVRDPVCGMHIAPGLALSVKNAGQAVHFCSPECRDKYLQDCNKFAANG